MLAALAGHAVSLQWHTFAALLALGHHAMLRTGELLKVTPGHVVWGSKSSTLPLPHTKIGQRTGELQSVSLTDKVVLKLLRAVCRNRHSPAPLFHGSGRTFRTMFQTCVHE
eukprot:2027827-Amphidinium_carterae.1